MNADFDQDIEKLVLLLGRLYESLNGKEETCHHRARLHDFAQAVNDKKRTVYREFFHRRSNVWKCYAEKKKCQASWNFF